MESHSYLPTKNDQRIEKLYNLKLIFYIPQKLQIIHTFVYE